MTATEAAEMAAIALTMPHDCWDTDSMEMFPERCPRCRLEKLIDTEQDQRDAVRAEVARINETLRWMHSPMNIDHKCRSGHWVNECRSGHWVNDSPRTGSRTWVEDPCPTIRVLDGES